MRASSREKKILRAMQGRGITISELASALGLKRRSLQNILNGTAQSRSTQQRISNFLQTPVFPGIQVTERIVPLPARTILVLPDDDSTAQFVQDAGALGYEASKRARVIRLLVGTELVFHLSNQKISSCSQTICRPPGRKRANE